MDHLLRSLALPTRYEPLLRKLGQKVASLLVEPPAKTLGVLIDACEAVRSNSEGVFLPVVAPSGTGKTTLINNLHAFRGMAPRYTETLNFTGQLVRPSLDDVAREFLDNLPASGDTRVIPLNIDDREGQPPTPAELAAIKGFLRGPVGQRVVVFWPATDPALANEMSRAYRTLAGRLPLDIPIPVEGPPADVWSSLAKQTLLLANGVESLEQLLDLDSYTPTDYSSFGDFLRQISADFNRRTRELREATQVPVRLTIAWVTHSPDQGILSALTSSSRFGMLDAGALLSASPGSTAGRWWAQRRGGRIATIIALDAHVLSVAPTLSVPIFRRYGPPETQQSFIDLGYSALSPSELKDYFSRSDLGRHLAGELRSVSEGRGNPGGAGIGFDLYANDKRHGFSGAKDKKLNEALAQALVDCLGVGPTVKAEKGVDALPGLIPDISISDDSGVHCIEPTYRKAKDFLSSDNRATVAEYCLRKLQNYSTSLGWQSR